VLRTAGGDALLFTSLPNIRYLTGFTGSEALFLLTAEDGVFLTDSRYTLQARNEVHGFGVREIRSKAEAIAAWVSEAECRSLCFEPDHLTWSALSALQKSLPAVEMVPAETGLDQLRSRKEPSEVEQMGKVAALASQAFLSLLPAIVPGTVERQLALQLEFAMRERGADDRSFDFIVASGERGALPHGRASTKMLQRGELVTFDFGAVCDGYCSDETVTVCLGSPDSRQRDVYRIVKEAHDLAIEAVRPGVPLRELDGVARLHIDKAGYGDNFGHGLGHGVGLQIHEGPVVSPRSEAVAEEGMVFTIEPGIYIPGWGGVRIEDMVEVTATGCRLLTAVNKELITV
jgi:Xaa-Pro aminopeptidase/Xaa-Pro dipeptidase